MKRVIALSGAIVAGVLSASAAREKPDLSGIWVAVKDTPSNLPAAPSAILGARMAIRHKGIAATRDAVADECRDRQRETHALSGTARCCCGE